MNEFGPVHVYAGKSKRRVFFAVSVIELVDMVSEMKDLKGDEI